VIIAAAIALSGCMASGNSPTVASGSTVDGFTLGVILKCSGPVGPVTSAALTAGCAGDPQRAVAALDARYPGHAAIISTSTWTDGTQPGAIDVTGGSPPPSQAPGRAGAIVTVFVFKLADGSIRATGVACPEQGTCVGVGTYPN
jgi:hypothetical protein